MELQAPAGVPYGYSLPAAALERTMPEGPNLAAAHIPAYSSLPGYPLAAYGQAAYPTPAPYPGAPYGATLPIPFMSANPSAAPLGMPGMEAAAAGLGAGSPYGVPLQLHQAAPYVAAPSAAEQGAHATYVRAAPCLGELRSMGGVRRRSYLHCMPWP